MPAQVGPWSADQRDGAYLLMSGEPPVASLTPHMKRISPPKRSRELIRRLGVKSVVRRDVR